MSKITRPEKTAAEVLAYNLGEWMRYRDLTQTALGTAAKVNQKTISNCLNPNQRDPSNKGKTPSPTLETLANIARALDTPLWMLLRPMEASPEAEEALNAMRKSGARATTHS